ncbi:phage tail tape measure protein [Chachezhania sediminis]|uniref:phage tail tape measure protein n=1 Tax=Chachezhania sediminis TaxID=2599291 RepID=UPI00131D7C52|nr:phage tail tape measure protein [Chachezhania sediminis]
MWEKFDELEERIDALGTSLGGTSQMAAGFDGELKRIRGSFEQTGKEIGGVERGMSNGLRRAFDGLLTDGMKLSDALKTVAESMIRSTYNAAMKPATEGLSGFLAKGIGKLVGGVLPFADGAAFAQGRVLPFADGAPFSQGRVVPFAEGGIFSGPTTFPMRGATGLMGEAGPEAIMPLTRGPDGKLGVRASGGSGGGGVNVTMNISTPDAGSFRRSQGQIAAQMGRMLGRGHRNR